MYFIEIDLSRIPETHPDLRERIEMINSLRAEPIGIVIAVEDDQCIGIMLHANNRLFGMAVLPEARKQGVGRSMIGFLKNRYNENVVTYVPPANTAAVGFFSIMGFKVEGTFLDNENVLNLRMVLGKSPKASIPPEEATLVNYLKNTPVFVSVAERMM